MKNKTTQKSLQKLTESEIKMNRILALDRVLFSDLKGLTKEEFKELSQILTEKLNDLKGQERDLFYDKIEPIIDDGVKNQLWENNHIQIGWAISSLIQEYGAMPNKTVIANKTNLSRQTIHKHLKEYKNHPEYIGKIEQFRFMMTKVLAIVFKLALSGDMGAAKLYFNVVGNLNEQGPQSISIKNQNNFIQINEMVLTQDAIKHLNPDQLKQIEGVLRSTLSIPKVAHNDPT